MNAKEVLVNQLTNSYSSAVYNHLIKAQHELLVGEISKL